MVDEVRQLQYWEGHGKRRSPTDPIIAAFVLPKVEFIRRVLMPLENPSILDVGCGNGYFTYYLSRWGQTVGIDFSKTMLSLNPCPLLAQASAYMLPFPDCSFDISFCSNLLHHLADPAAALNEMKRVSRRYVVISEPNRNNPAILLLGLVKREERETLRFTLPYVRGLATSAGLSVIASQAMGFVTPNLMPSWAVSLLKRFNGPNPLAACIVVVSERPDGTV